MKGRVWLMKTEPETFSFADLLAAPGQKTAWEGVRNYQARNLLRDEIQVGDTVLFYHSSCRTPGIVGLAKVTEASSPDATQFDPESAYFDPGARRDAPRWYVVEIQAERPVATPLTLTEMRGLPALAELALLRRGNRLSVQPVDAASWAYLRQRL